MSIIRIVPEVKSYVDNKEKVNFNKLSLDFCLSKFEYELLSCYLDDKSNNKIIFKKDIMLKEGAYFINVYQDEIECI